MIFSCPQGYAEFRPSIELHARRLLAGGHQFRYAEAPLGGEDADLWDERLQGAHGVLLLGDLPRGSIARNPQLEVISICGTGVSPSVDLTVAAEHGVAVCNVPAYGSNAVAEHAIALAFAVARNIPQGDVDIRRGEFPVRVGLELAGKTLGVVGAGSIGERTLAIGRALGMRTLFWTRHGTAKRAARLAAEYAELDDLFARSDVVSLHLPHLPETDGLIGERLLARLPDGAILINTARAGIVDGGALARLLASGRIRGAGVDVFETEPPSRDDPLLTAPNVVLSPHAAANTPDAIDRMVSVAIENLIRWTVGEPQNIVSPPPGA